ncbi:MAG: YifB family Mg chelatase-like AAA ATPase [Deltaproteobacteria bacterium]|nr:YifB family Mg chelatase-like AAA ATPase [Deltaproteobacteria bacterium]MBW2412909.1 YifB family Mg chelatase-like AAA ATPase [Deltaproteobacteria bacterium]
MLTRVWGATLYGIEGRPVSVEVDAGRGLPSFQIVGQGDRVVSESRDRIRAAFRQSGLEFPPGRVTVNLAPSEIPKAGSALDLPIAVAIAAAREPVEFDALASVLLLGELGLDGTLRAVRGAAALTSAAPLAGLQRVVVPLANLDEAAGCPGARVFGAETLTGVLGWLQEKDELVLAAPGARTGPEAPRGPDEPDLADVRGQPGARRALEIAAAGRHNLLMVGPPGSGKTLLARRLPGLLPDLDDAEAREATRIHSVAGTLGGAALLRRPPFRAPHHTTSDAGMTGGGRPLRPGEISLAHRGVLFLDELPEFRRPVLEALRQPLEEGAVRLVRAGAALDLPARFQLVAAMNPCPCGYHGDERHECQCDDPAIARYRRKLSGPLLDRIDLHVPVPPVPVGDVLPTRRADNTNERSASVAARVLAARERQALRYADRPFLTNAELPPADLARVCALDRECRTLLERALETLGLSMRAVTRVLRVARSIADLAADDAIEPSHLAEAIGCRSLDER